MAISYRSYFLGCLGSNSLQLTNSSDLIDIWLTNYLFFFDDLEHSLADNLSNAFEQFTYTSDSAMDVKN